MSMPGPGFAAPDFVGCYRHPERLTGISCQRCGQPICGECMTEAAVGFQCPSCVGKWRKSRAGSSAQRPRFGAGLGASTGRATIVLMAALAAVWVFDLVTRGLATAVLAMSTSYVAIGQYWRLMTSVLVSGTLLGMLMNLLVLWLVGRAVESELGSVRFVLLYLASGLGGATLFYLIAPYGAWSVGASSAIVGLLAANTIGKARTGEDVRPDIGLLVLLVLYAVLIGFASFGWLSLIGGMAVGAASGALFAYGPKRGRLGVQVAGMIAVMVVCLGLVVIKSAF